MTLGETEAQVHLKARLKAGASVVKVRPLFTYDAKCIILASGVDVKVYSIQSGECVRVLKHHQSRVISLQESKKNPLQFYSCSEDGTVVRWDHSEGKVLQVKDLKEPLVCFFIPKDDYPWFAVKKEGVQFQLYALHPDSHKKMLYRKLFSPVQPFENTIVFGLEGLFAAAVFKNYVQIFNLETKLYVRHYTEDLILKCIASHPSEQMIATGDHEGRITVWSNIWDAKSPIRSTYHWHSLPVMDLFFSTEGSYLYSGGGEAALVKWNLFSNERSILPRLGAPIYRLNASKENGLVVTAHKDNTVQIINSSRIVIQVIQGMTQGHFQGSKSENDLPTGLLYDPRTKALVLNGKPGHLQFYDAHEDKKLFHLDISGRNFVSQTRNKWVFNTDVQRAAMDEKGCWLATAEYWNDGKVSPQIWLKFWEFNVPKQTFVLNTNVFLPHNKKINCMLFQPQNAPDEMPLLVTTSPDLRFKIWSLVDSSDKQSWTCEYMGCYRDLPAGSASFSEDGSLLAVAFDKTATLWTVDVMNLKVALFHEKNKRGIKQVSFGRQSCSHFLLTHDGDSVTAWNILSVSISWIIRNPVQVLVADPFSNLFAAFCRDLSLIIFRPENPKPVFYKENITEKPVLSAIFVPSKKEIPLLKNSQLFFMDGNKNLLTLVDENEEDDVSSSTVTISQNLPATPFALLQAESKVSGVKTFEPQPFVDFTSGNLKQLNFSCPTSTDPIKLCSEILQALLLPVEKTKT